MNHSALRLFANQKVCFAAALVFSICVAVPNTSAAPCPQTTPQSNQWVERSVNSLVRAARAAYENDNARARYERTVRQIAGEIKRCRLSDDRSFVDQYPEFAEYVRLLALALDKDHELGFEVSDEVYFAETNRYTAIPDFLLTPQFLRAVSRFENLPQAKAMLREMNSQRAPANQLIFFSYTSRHLGTPDNPNSFRRLLIVVPADNARQLPEKWVQFGIADPRRPASVRNVSVVAVLPRKDDTASVYFKDYYRTYRRNGSITIKGRWELGEGDDNCVECHKSGVLPIFPVANSVSRDEVPLVGAVNERFLAYGPARFDRYLDTTRFGPGLGSTKPSQLFRQTAFTNADINSNSGSCSSCHEPNGLGALNWPMDSTLISSFVKGGQMPLNSQLRHEERARLYRQLVEDYFGIDDVRPGILKAWLLGKAR
jgi:hypothetical protein